MFHVFLVWKHIVLVYLCVCVNMLTAARTQALLSVQKVHLSHKFDSVWACVCVSVCLCVSAKDRALSHKFGETSSLHSSHSSIYILILPKSSSLSVQQLNSQLQLIVHWTTDTHTHTHTITHTRTHNSGNKSCYNQERASFLKLKVGPYLP